MAVTGDHDFIEQAARRDGDRWRDQKVSADAATVSIAMSLKRIADMMEEDRKPRIELAPEGWVSDQEHRRIIREGLAADNALMERVAIAIETATAAKTPKRGLARKGESAGRNGIAQTPSESPSHDNR